MKFPSKFPQGIRTLRPVLSLPFRSFLISFLPLCLVILASFFVIDGAIKAKIRQSLKKSIQRTEMKVGALAARDRQQSRQLLAILTESSALKAGIGLLREAPASATLRQQVRDTIESQIEDLEFLTDYDMILVSDPSGTPVAGFVGKEGISPNPIQTWKVSPFVELNGDFYETMTMPVRLGGETLGNLTLGRRFGIQTWNFAGDAALVKDGQVLLTSLLPEAKETVERQLQANCPTISDDCQIQLGGASYLVFESNRAGFGSEYRLLTLRSMDQAMAEFTSGFTGLRLIILACGLMVTLLLSAASSRTVSKPLTDLVLRLRKSEKTGRLAGGFRTDYPVKEVNLLAEAFNRAAQSVGESQRELDQTYLEFIETMAQALDARDPYTAGHSDRVSLTAVSIAREMDMPEDRVETLRIGAKLHDIGKIGVPDAVLQKPEQLSRDEFELIKLHPETGRRILERVGAFKAYLPIVELHHENQNGSGYPYGLRGEEIPLEVRIVHVADVYDALSSHRAYRPAMPEETVLKMIVDAAGTMFDPDVVEAFLYVHHRRKILQGILDPKPAAGALPEKSPVSGIAAAT